MDGRSRVARVKVVDGDPDEVRYNLEDHLGNAAFTLNGDGSLTLREEYFPFGETSFESYAIKRYRFCGKERDEESGLYYYGARYYAPWTCRFVSIDPLAGNYPFYTPYQYAGNKPINFIDLDGLEETLPQQGSEANAGGNDSGGQVDHDAPSGGGQSPKATPKPAPAEPRASAPGSQASKTDVTAAPEKSVLDWYKNIPSVFKGAFPEDGYKPGDLTIKNGVLYKYEQRGNSYSWNNLGNYSSGNSSGPELDVQIGQWLESVVGGNGGDLGADNNSIFTKIGQFVGETVYTFHPAAGFINMVTGKDEVTVANVAFAVVGVVGGGELSAGKGLVKKVAQTGVEHLDEAVDVTNAALHHLASNKHLTKYTALFEQIASYYKLSLDGPWNKLYVSKLDHYCKHPEK